MADPGTRDAWQAGAISLPLGTYSAGWSHGMAHGDRDSRRRDRDAEDLVTQRLAIGLHRCTALANIGRRVVDDLIDLALVEQRAKGSLVPLLCFSFTLALPALGPIAAGRAVRGRRLGRILRVQLQPLLRSCSTPTSACSSLTCAARPLTCAARPPITSWHWGNVNSSRPRMGATVAAASSPSVKPAGDAPPSEEIGAELMGHEIAKRDRSVQR